MATMNRSAKCSCGQLEVFLRGNPFVTGVCSCKQCQRRTGSAFGVGAYFEDTQLIEIKGIAKIYNQLSDAERNVERYFCKACGTTLYWKAEFQPNYIGVAVGCFNDPDFPEPSASVWNCSKFKWVEFPKKWVSLLKQGDVES